MQQFEDEDFEVFHPGETEERKNVFVKLSRAFQDHELEDPDNPVRDAEHKISSHDVLFFLFTTGIGFFMIILSFLYLPAIVIAPKKFCSLFTLGSASMIYGIIFLKGFGGTVNYFCHSKKRFQFIAFFITMILTFYYTIIKRSYWLAMLFSIIQVFFIQ